MQQQIMSTSHAFIVEGVDMAAKDNNFEKANGIESRTWEEEFCNRMINTALPEPGVQPANPDTSWSNKTAEQIRDDVEQCLLEVLQRGLSIPNQRIQSDKVRHIISEALSEAGYPRGSIHVKPLTPREIKERQINLEVILWIE